MLMEMKSFDNDTNGASNSHKQINSVWLSSDLLHCIPPKKPRLDLTSTSLYSRYFSRKSRDESFSAPDPESTPDISFVVSPGIDTIQKFRKPFISVENAPINLSKTEYKDMLDLATSGLVTSGSLNMVEVARKLRQEMGSNPASQSRDDRGAAEPTQMASTSSASSSSSSTSSAELPVSALTSMSDTEVEAWCSRVSESPYLSSEWLSEITSSVASSSAQCQRQCARLEEQVKFWANQRRMSEEAKMNELEARLACLLRTPAVVEDPYLKPQPIPQELPYKRPAKASEQPKLPVLTEAQIKALNARLAESTGPTAVLVTAYRLAVRRSELLTLSGSAWLNDQVINFYLKMLEHRSQLSSSNRKCPKVCMLNSHFYVKLTAQVGGGYAGVRRWTRAVKIFEHDLLLVPIHDRGIHWCLVGIDMRKRTISYYDSMGGSNNRCLKEFLKYLENEHQDKLNAPLPDVGSWKLINTQDAVPQQSNGSDCGVFLCTFAEFLSRDADFTFSQEDMPGIRQRMMYEILHRCLLTTNTQLVDA